mmetsp:Transcript_8436/g.12670  ORF Transcript_8436/g.12670 Transcript_8436/m.12670 type:complete len:384 (-) Transcript_8436:262-1413(-)
MSYDRVTEGLYVGDYEAAKDLKILEELGITCIVACGFDSGYFEKVLARRFKYFCIDIIDSPSSNLLRFLPKVTKFIEKAIEIDGGVVFVHCVHGQSRSCAVCVAYLMDVTLRKEQVGGVENSKADHTHDSHGGGSLGRKTCDPIQRGRVNILHACYDQVMESRQQMAINPGFVKQLDMFCKMKYVQQTEELSRTSTVALGSEGKEMTKKEKKMYVSRAFAYHRSFRAKSQFYDTGTISSKFCPLIVEEGNKTYICQSCRTTLFTEMNIIDDWTEEEISLLPTSDYWENSKGGLDYMKLYSKSNMGGENNFRFEALLAQKAKIYKVEPMKWMENLLKDENGDILNSSGDLTCPKCSTTLGYWDLLNEKELATALIILKNKTVAK